MGNDFSTRITDAALEGYSTSSWYESTTSYTASDIIAGQQFAVTFTFHITDFIDYLGIYGISVQCDPLTLSPTQSTINPTINPSQSPTATTSIPTNPPSTSPTSPTNLPSVSPT